MNGRLFSALEAACLFTEHKDKHEQPKDNAEAERDVIRDRIYYSDNE